jgi:hypothetical protein
MLAFCLQCFLFATNKKNKQAISEKLRQKHKQADVSILDGIKVSGCAY